MEKWILPLLMGILLTAAQVYAGNGDLIVDGNVGIGTLTPQEKLDVSGGNICLNNWGRISGIRHDQNKFSNLILGGALRYNGDSTYTAIGDGGSNYYAAIKMDNSGGNVGAINFYTGASTGGSNYALTESQLASHLAMTIVGQNVGIGTSNPGSYKLYVAGTSYATGTWQSSDLKYKKNIRPISSALDKLIATSGVSFDWKIDEYKDKGFPENRHYGVIAQEIEKTLPEVVTTGPDGTKAVAYTEIIPVLIEAIKEQQKQIGELKSMIKKMNKYD